MNRRYNRDRRLHAVLHAADSHLLKDLLFLVRAIVCTVSVQKLLEKLAVKQDAQVMVAQGQHNIEPLRDHVVR